MDERLKAYESPASVANKLREVVASGMSDKKDIILHLLAVAERTLLLSKETGNTAEKITAKAVAYNLLQVADELQRT